ncbi:hypothetical protein [Pseudomonas antarctica]|uniref:hypothetical protein n=1 Tax=Pseudomonas antarctica TaxID=219572 RepID=UPI003F7504BF
MSTRFRCASACDVATLLKSIGVWKTAMAVRKKVETIHLRVSAVSKACLEGLANAAGKTSTHVLEKLIAEAAAKHVITGVEAAVHERFWGNGDWTLLKAMQLAYVPDDPILRKMRIYFLADEEVSHKDRFFVEAILWSPDLFAGETEIFHESEQVLTEEDDPRLWKVDLDAINRQMASLENYAEFRLKNKSVAPKYKDYLKMIEEKPKS